MGPLVYYCRWRGAKLRLRGRDAGGVWGQLVTQQEDGEHIESFRFHLYSWELELGEGESATHLRLDELGVVIPDEHAGNQPKTSADGERQ